MLPGVHDQASESIGSIGVLPAALPMRKKRLLKKYWPWGLMLAVAVVAIVLGYVGLVKYFAADGEQRSFLALLYLIVCLFAVETGNVTGSAPWELDVARILAPMLPAWAIFQAVAILFRDQWQALRLMLRNRHVVICGLGRKGFQLARAFRARGDYVVVIEEDEGNDALVSCRELGIMTLVCNATDPTTLSRARPQYAGHVFAVCGEDGTNVEIAVQLDELIRNRERHRTHDVRCHVQIVNLELCELFRQHRVFLDSGNLLKVCVFNTFENSTRLLWHFNPLDRVRISYNDARSVHLIVIGFGQMGESVVLRAARMAHFANGKPLQLTVVDELAEVKCKRFSGRYPHFDRVCDARFMTGCPSDKEVATEICLMVEQPNTIATIAVCLDGDALALSVALQLLHRLRSSDVSVIVRMAEEKGLATLFHSKQDQTSHVAERLHAFGMTGRSCSLDLLLNEDLDRLAMERHECYRDKNKADVDPASRLWDDLSENLKDSNRYLTDHIPVKLRAIGCYASTAKTGDQLVKSFTDDEVEIMARMEHARWNAERWLDKWNVGPRDHPSKTSPYLVDWDHLSDQIQQKDREAVKHIPALLDLVNAKIYRSGIANEKPRI